MRKTFAAVLTVALALGVATSQARALGLGQRHDLAFGADRLFGLYLGERHVDQPGPDLTIDFGMFGLGVGTETTPLNRPRLAFDYFVIDGLSVGGTLGFYIINNDNRNGNGLFLTPRVGYLIGLGEVVGFWPRGGFTIYTLSDDPIDQRQFALSLEGMFVIAPAQHFSFELGPTIDLGFSGELGNSDMHEWSVGLAMGLLGWLDL
jgi:hypothetical protein